MKLQKQGLATIGLIFITVLAAIQYIFLQNVPDTVSTFAFLSITNLIGFLIMAVFGIYLLFPNLFSDDTLETETYLLLIAWSIIGFFYFHRIITKDHARRFGSGPRHEYVADGQSAEVLSFLFHFKNLP